MEKQKKFAQLLKEKRSEQKLSFRALSKLSEISPTVLVLYEKGQNFPSSESLERLCELFGWDFKSTYLLIQNEKNPEKTLTRHFQVIQPEYPEIRKTLLDLYNSAIIYEYDPNDAFARNVAVKVFESMNLASKNEMKQELDKYPTHLVEPTLLLLVLRYSNHQNPELSDKTALDYFQSLKSDERESLIKSVVVLWAYDIAKHSLFARLKITNEKGETQYIARMYSLKFVAISDEKEIAEQSNDKLNDEAKK